MEREAVGREDNEVLAGEAEAKSTLEDAGSSSSSVSLPSCLLFGRPRSDLAIWALERWPW